jgi:hypothetical protein
MLKRCSSCGQKVIINFFKKKILKKDVFNFKFGKFFFFFFFFFFSLRFFYKF